MTRSCQQMRSQRAYYDASFSSFLQEESLSILGALVAAHHHDVESLQRNAWQEQIAHLKSVLPATTAGRVLFEFSIPRMGKRADVLLFFPRLIILIEYKVGAIDHSPAALKQTLDYAIDLKNFHQGSHDFPIIPVTIATEATPGHTPLSWHQDQVAYPLSVSGNELSSVVDQCLALHLPSKMDYSDWVNSPYKPTPTIIEASQALYQGHGVAEISRSDAGASNLTRTTESIFQIIDTAKRDNKKCVCFVTGVPGSGKTLAGLNVANERRSIDKGEHAVFLSGNGPLVMVLQEALARDEVSRSKLSKDDALRKTTALVQNIHHFRDEYLATSSAPVEKVVIFDEAQRAWNKEKTSDFMKKKRGLANFDLSEPELLLKTMDRHQDWCVVICLVGGGQEINTGEAGLVEWFDALRNTFASWNIFYSDQIQGNEYTWGQNLFQKITHLYTQPLESLHLTASIRSFRSEKLSTFISHIIDAQPTQAASLVPDLSRFPVFLTREIEVAREWLREQARGSERFGLVASSNAIRLKPEGIHVKNRIDPRHWFLNDSSDVRSSYYLEDVATEFDIQGLELDWVGVCWDGNLRYEDTGWATYQFRGTNWQRLTNEYRKAYLINAYRVLLTRARQGMIVYIPKGSHNDPTRLPSLYDGTHNFLRRCGIEDL